MATDKQINANRENAQHSTGPSSPQGKAAVSQNRTTHGLNYNPGTFRVLACEDQAQYDALVMALVEEQKPTDTTEKILVTAMARHRWLLDRANRLQETCFDQETAQIADQKLFSLYLRYATTHERAFHKCLNDLLKLRNQKIKEQIGFESEKRKADRHQSFLEIDKFHQRVEYVKSVMVEHRADREIRAEKRLWRRNKPPKSPRTAREHISQRHNCAYGLSAQTQTSQATIESGFVILMGG